MGQLPLAPDDLARPFRLLPDWHARAKHWLEKATSPDRGFPPPDPSQKRNSTGTDGHLRSPVGPRPRFTPGRMLLSSQLGSVAPRNTDQEEKEMEILMFALIFDVVVGVIANSRGRSGIGWFVLSVLFSPILMLILVLALPRVREQQEHNYDMQTWAQPRP